MNTLLQVLDRRAKRDRDKPVSKNSSRQNIAKWKAGKPMSLGVQMHPKFNKWWCMSRSVFLGFLNLVLQNISQDSSSRPQLHLGWRSNTLSTEIHRTILTTTDFYLSHDIQPADMVFLHTLQTYTSLDIVTNFYCKWCLKVFSLFPFLLILRLNLLLPTRFFYMYSVFTIRSFVVQQSYSWYFKERI
jgi:hypothetical protein